MASQIKFEKNPMVSADVATKVAIATPIDAFEIQYADGTRYSRISSPEDCAQENALDESETLRRLTLMAQRDGEIIVAQEQAAVMRSNSVGNSESKNIISKIKTGNTMDATRDLTVNLPEPALAEFSRQPTVIIAQTVPKSEYVVSEYKSDYECATDGQYKVSEYKSIYS